MPHPSQPQPWSVAWRQLTVFLVFLIFIAMILGTLYFKDRQQEWRLRGEQAEHRLNLSYELLARDIERVRADALFVANTSRVRAFDRSSPDSIRTVEQEFENFLTYQPSYQQIRLVDLDGREQVRVDLVDGQVKPIPGDQLQDKSDRYYIQDSLSLKTGEVLVSEFDLNQEYGVIETPLRPVIRFVTPVELEGGRSKALLVINYLGTPLLNELRSISMPGRTLLVRQDGQYILAPRSNDAWGWLLGHSTTFGSQFPEFWNAGQLAEAPIRMTDKGAFAARSIRLQQIGAGQPTAVRQRDQLFLVSYLPRDEVFSNANQLLTRLTVLVACLLLPLFFLIRIWAIGAARREMQNRLILASESKLRELSSRLLRIQEEERRAISRELHDQLGQQITAINLDLKMAQRQQGSSAGNEQLDRAIQESEHLLSSLHHFVTRIRPVELDDLGLHDAVESHLWEFQRRSGIEVEFDSSVDQVELPSTVVENVFRLIQEALNNVRKHAQATRVQILLAVENQPTASSLMVVVSDDGQGATQSEIVQSDRGRRRLGILGMQERVELLGGTIDISSQPESGTRIEVSIPLQ